MEVVGNRELAFFPGTCRGCAFSGFVYHSEEGTRAVELRIPKAAFSKGIVPGVFRSYYNGGGVFVDAPKFENHGVEVLASFTEDLDVDAGEGSASVVYCKLKQNRFAASNLDPTVGLPGYDRIVKALKEDDQQRIDFLKACLLKLGLQVSQEETAIPSLSRLHLSSVERDDMSRLVEALKDIITERNGEQYIEDENDTFHLEKPSRWSLASVGDNPTRMTDGSSDHREEEEEEAEKDQAKIIEYDKIVKRLLIHDTGQPESKDTPYFNHHAYVANLKYYEHQSQSSGRTFGKELLYGEVVTSTNTLLEK
ncbi:MAG: hypothetical protein Q9198_006406 [Flavoplaca austrocitrina]